MDPTADQIFAKDTSTLDQAKSEGSAGKSSNDKKVVAQVIDATPTQNNTNSVVSGFDKNTITKLSQRTSVETALLR